MTSPIAKCVARKMASDDPKDKDLTQKQKLGKYYGMCREELDALKDFLEKEDLSFTSPVKSISQKVMEIKQRREYAKTKREEHQAFFRPFQPLSKVSTGGKSTSENVVAMGYRYPHLEVGFNSGRIYGYKVDPMMHEMMAKAQSKGKFVWEWLRGKVPGYVIDDPTRKTPGGVGGSIVPYLLLSPSRLPSGMEDKLKKYYKKVEKKRGIQEKIKNIPFASATQPFKLKTAVKGVQTFKKKDLEDLDIKGGESKVMSAGQKALIEKVEKRYRKDFDTSDAIPVKKYTRTDPRTGKIIEVGQYSRKGEAAKKILGKVKGLQKTPLPEPGGKKPPKKPSKKGLTPEERKRKEIERQARGIKKQPKPDPREEAIRKLIEKTGYERKRAEAEIRKKFGPSKEEQVAEEKQKKVQEKTQEQIKQKQQQLQKSVTKLQFLNQRNFKSEALSNILQLFIDVIKGKDVKDISKRFARNYLSIKRDQKINLQKKTALLGVITKLNLEIQGLSKPQKDFDSRAKYYCSHCQTYHYTDSEIGRRHKWLYGKDVFKRLTKEKKKKEAKIWLYGKSDFEVQDAEAKSGWERCVEWMEKKGETDDPEGTCYGILRGFAKKKKEKEEREKKRKMVIRKALRHIQKKREKRKNMKQLKNDVEWYQTLIKDAESTIEKDRELIKNAEKRLPLAQTKSGKKHWEEEKYWAQKSIDGAEKRIKGYHVEIRKAKEALKERRKEERDLYFSRQELHQHFRDLKEDDPYLSFPARIHKNLQFAKNVNLSDWNVEFNIKKWDEALRFLPTPFQNATEIRIYNEITDDPDKLEDPDKPPKYYEDVGWDRKNRDVDGEIDYDFRRIRIRAGEIDPHGTIWHEIGHAVWKYGKWRFNEEYYFKDLWKKMKSTLAMEGQVGQYQINNVNEFFAVQFERYFRGRWQQKNFGKRDNDALPEVSKWFDDNLRRYEYDKNFIREDLIESIKNFIRRER